MRKLILIGLGVYGLAAVWRAEEKEDGLLVALSPFVAAVARHRPADAARPARWHGSVLNRASLQPLARGRARQNSPWLRQNLSFS
jgi:hypothetical protein